MRNVLGWMCLLLIGCGIEEDDVSLPKTPVSWSLTGGLDTKRSPLVIQPGSHLTLDNVIQERLNEWRRRNGFTQVAADAMPESAPYFVGRLGALGMLALGGVGGLVQYSPTVTPRWSQIDPATAAVPQYRTRTPIVASASAPLGMARAGNVVVTSQFNGTLVDLHVFDVASGNVIASPQISGTSGFTGTPRGAATSTKLVTTYLQDATVPGNDGIYVVVTDVATGVSGAAVKIKAGTFASVDAMYFTGSTVTIVAATAAGAVRFIEYNPTTGALSTDVAVGGLTAYKVFLMADAEASGVRLMGATFSTPTTRVLRLSSAGAVLTNDQAEAVESSVITGVSANAGADWYIVYRTLAGALRMQSKASGVVGTPTPTVYSGTIDSQAWRDPGAYAWRFLMGLHSTNVDDPQDTWIEMAIPIGTSMVDLPASVVVGLASGTVPVGHGIAQVVRTAAYKFSTVLPVQVVYEDNAGVIVRHYSLDLFEQTLLTSADDAVSPTRFPVQYKQTAYIPAGELSFFDQGGVRRLGTRTPPRSVALTPSVAGGALTALAEYGYVDVIEAIDGDGNIWRSPQSAPTLVTLTGAQNTVGVTAQLWELDRGIVAYRLALYRTDANGSSYRRIFSQMFTPGTASILYTDLLADTAVVDGEILYTQGELQTAITPPASVIWFHDDRMFAINREYPTEAWYTKNLRPGRQPEFTNEGIVDLDDEFGDLTNGASLDTQNVLFKKNAIYFGTGDGFTDAGSGTNYRFDRISGDVGAIAGSPLVAADDKIYFVSERGIYTVDKQGAVAFMDAADQYLNQPLVQTRETVYDGCFVPSTNQVVFVTTNYLLIHDLTFKHWRRTTGLPGMRRCLVIDGRLVLFKNDGTVWREGDQTQLTDQGTAFEGVIRSPWMRPTQGVGGPGTGSTATAGQQGMRIYRGRVIYTRTAGGSTVNLRGRIYRNNDDADYEEFNSGGIPGSVLSGVGEMVPRVSKCTSFSLELALPSGDCTVRIDGFAAIVGTRESAQVTGQGDRWK